MTRESPFVPVDGELFWSDQEFDGKAARGKGVDGFNAAVRMRLHHHSSFSLAHSYSEREGALTHAASSTSGRAKHQIGSYQLRCPVRRHPRRTPRGRRSFPGTRGSGGVL